MCCVTRQNNRKERLRRKVQFLLTIIKITETIYHEIPVSDFIYDQLRFFSLSLKIFSLKSFEKKLFFFYKNANISYLVTHPHPPNKMS